MTTSVLIKTGSVTLDANGNGLIQFKPDVGQNWYIFEAKVSTVSQASPLPYCAVHHGGANLQDNTTLVDDTSTGNNDITGALSADIVVFGEAVTAVFQAGMPGDNAFFRIVGFTSDIPPGAPGAPLPSVLGVRFNGKTATNIFPVVNNPTVPIGLAVNASNVSPVVGVGNSGGYEINLAATVAAPGSFNQLLVKLEWYSDPNGVNLVFEDTFMFYVNQGGGLPYPYGRLFLQDQMHGPYMRIRLVNVSSNTDTIQVTTYTASAITRPSIAKLVKEVNYTEPSSNYVEPESQLAATYNGGFGAGGGTLVVPCKLSRKDSRARLRVASNAAITVTLMYGLNTAGRTLDSAAIAANGTYTPELILPQHAVRMVFTGAVAATFDWSLTEQDPA